MCVEWKSWYKTVSSTSFAVLMFSLSRISNGLQWLTLGYKGNLLYHYFINRCKLCGVCYNQRESLFLCFSLLQKPNIAVINQTKNCWLGSLLRQHCSQGLKRNFSRTFFPSPLLCNVGKTRSFCTSLHLTIFQHWKGEWGCWHLFNGY